MKNYKDLENQYNHLDSSLKRLKEQEKTANKIFVIGIGCLSILLAIGIYVIAFVL